MAIALMGTGSGSESYGVWLQTKALLFWVDGDNVLWRQHWDDVSTKAQ